MLHVFLLVLALQIYVLRPGQFFENVSPQRERPKSTFGSAQAVIIEEQYKQFQSNVSSSFSTRQDTQKYEGCTLSGGGIFLKSWPPFYRHFGHLACFLGGLGALFPVMCSVESYFSVIRLEKGDHSTTMINLNFNLEGIVLNMLATCIGNLLHGKQ